MPMQAIQGMPVQIGAPKSGNDPAKVDPADFLNVLAALLMPKTPTPGTINPEPVQNQVEPASTQQAALLPQNMAKLPVSLPALETVQAAPADLSGNEGAETAANNLKLTVTQGQQQDLPESLIPPLSAQSAVPEADAQTQAPEVTPSQQKLESTKGKDNLQVGQQAAAKAVLPAEEPEAKVPEKDKKTQPAANQSEHLGETIPIAQLPTAENVAAGKRQFKTESTEQLNPDKVTPEIQGAVKTVSSKSESGQAAWEKDMEVKEELHPKEHSSGGQEVRSFANYLNKDVVSGKELKTIPSEYKVPSQELSQEFPRIIESQFKDAAGKEISRDIIIHLEPKELGKLTVKLTSQEGIITVKIMTEHAETRNIVESGLTNLRQSFSEQGIKYGRMEVELGGQSLYQQHHQPQQQQQQQQQQSQLYWSTQQTAPSTPWQEVGYYPEDSNVNAVSRLKPSGAVDYRV